MNLNQKIAHKAPGLILAVVAAALLAACAGTGGPVPAEVSVEERAQERWDHLIARDFQTAWQLHSPGFREATPADEFARDMVRRPVRWLAAEVRSADCEGDLCNVRVAVTYQAVAAPAGQRRIRMTRTLEETWIRLDGQWWFSQN
jgi:hypothetical protein